MGKHAEKETKSFCFGHEKEAEVTSDKLMILQKHRVYANSKYSRKETSIFLKFPLQIFFAISSNPLRAVGKR